MLIHVTEFFTPRSLMAALVISANATGLAAAQGSITIGFGGGLGPTDVPSILALKELEADGWTTDFIEFDSPDIQTQALINGDIDIAAMGPATVMSANAAGADLRMIARNNALDFLVVSKTDVENCSDLDGRTVAYHSPGATTTAHLFRYMEQNCPDAKPNYIVVSGSANRSAALLNGQIDGTIVRMEDWVAATSGDAGNDAKVLAVLADDQSNLLAQMIVVSADQIDEKRNEINTFLEALRNEFDKVKSDGAGYASKTLEYLPGAEESNVSGVYGALVEAGLFPESLGISQQQVEDTIKFYEDAGRIDAGVLTSEKVADFSFSDM